MKSNQVSVLVVLLLCLVMGGFLYVVDRSSDEEAGWIPSELYGELGARSYEGSSFSNVTFSGGGNSDGVAVSMRNGSFSLRTCASRASSLTPNNPIASSPNNLPSLQGGAGGRLSSPNSLIGHMTSSAEFRSFGGGSNMAMGSYTSSSNNLLASSPAIGSYSPSPIAYNPITSSPNNLIAYSPSNGEVQVSAEQSLMSASSSASGLFGSAMQNTYGTASYDQTVYGSYGSKPSGVRGRQNTNANDGSEDAYAAWLRWFSSVGKWYGTYDEGTGTYTFDNEQSESAYAAWYYLTYGIEYDPSNPDGGLVVPVVSYQQWLGWFLSNGGEHSDGTNTFKFTPVGDILPLFMLAFLYLVGVFVRRRKSLAGQA